MSLITDENKLILIKRLKSLAWRVGMMTVAVLIDFAAGSMGLLSIGDEYTVVIGLILGELSKYVNTRISQ